MEFVERSDGLVVPKRPPAKPSRKYGAVEIRCEGRRKQAEQALGMLWTAMGLYGGPGGIVLDDVPKYADAYRLYCYFAESILGKDYPEFEQLC